MLSTTVDLFIVIKDSVLTSSSVEMCMNKFFVSEVLLCCNSIKNINISTIYTICMHYKALCNMNTAKTKAPEACLFF